MLQFPRWDLTLRRRSPSLNGVSSTSTALHLPPVLLQHWEEKRASPAPWILPPPPLPLDPPPRERSAGAPPGQQE
jgi:hypothetical protein